jgi:hypothetical protein
MSAIKLNGEDSRISTLKLSGQVNPESGTSGSAWSGNKKPSHLVMLSSRNSGRVPRIGANRFRSESFANKDVRWPEKTADG